MTATFLGLVNAMQPGTAPTQITPLRRNARKVVFQVPLLQAGKVWIGGSTLNKTTGAGVARILPVDATSEPQAFEINSPDGDPIQMEQYYLDSDLTLAAAKTITDATNASPIVISAAAHGYSNGDRVFISGVVGNTAANGWWTITYIGTGTFSLDGSVGNGDYDSGGEAQKATLYGVLVTFWE